MHHVEEVEEEGVETTGIGIAGTWMNVTDATGPVTGLGTAQTTIIMVTDGPVEGHAQGHAHHVGEIGLDPGHVTVDALEAVAATDAGGGGVTAGTGGQGQVQIQDLGQGQRADPEVGHEKMQTKTRMERSHEADQPMGVGTDLDLGHQHKPLSWHFSYLIISSVILH